ncbi:MAG TPA: molybdopterin converting factor subunit 1 [Burkholderiaceae bacterium]|nr:molybdopterin converting factor subunit 1 [Burkholderiaceae bacterium]
MRVTVLYFARLREALQCEREVIDVPADVRTVTQLRAWLVARGEPWSSAFGEIKRIRAAIDQAMAQDTTPLHEGAEVAFFPPVTGG